MNNERELLAGNEGREKRLEKLRALLDASIAEGGEVSDAELDADIAEIGAELRSKGIGG